MNNGPNSTGDRKATRDAYGHALLDLMAADPRVVVLDADLSRSTRTEWIQQTYPDRFVNVGIAEQNLFGIAAGLAKTGFVPFATTYAIFIGRGFDQIRQSVCFNSANVKIVATHGGLAASYDGGSHQGTEDIAIMRVLPRMTVLSPIDYNQARTAVAAAAAIDGPVYLRLQKEATPVLTEPGPATALWAPQLLKQGADGVILATGTICAEALEAADVLAQRGHNVSVVALNTIKPFPTEALSALLPPGKPVFTVEEHSLIGGLYETVCTAMQNRFEGKIVGFGLNDCFGETGSWNDLKSHFGLNSEKLSAEISQHLMNKEVDKRYGGPIDPVQL